MRGAWRTRRSLAAFPSSRSFPHLPAGELEKQILEIRAPVHEAKIVEAPQALDGGRGIAKVTERRLAVQPGAVAQSAAVGIHPSTPPVPVGLDPLGLYLPR